MVFIICKKSEIRKNYGALTFLKLHAHNWGEIFTVKLHYCTLLVRCFPTDALRSPTWRKGSTFLPTPFRVSLNKFPPTKAFIFESSLMAISEWVTKIKIANYHKVVLCYNVCCECYDRAVQSSNATIFIPKRSSRDNKGQCCE